MRLFIWFFFAWNLSGAGELPVSGLASVGFRVSDLGQARNFYTGLLGYEEAFALAGKDGRLERVFLKVNEEQFIELLPGLPSGESERLAHIAIQCKDLRGVHRELRRRGLVPPPITIRPDGNPGFALKDPGGTQLEFLEYVPGGRQFGTRGKNLGANRISQRLWHTGVVVLSLEEADRFYHAVLGFRETWRGGPTEGELRWVNMEMPGRGDYLEYMLASRPPDRRQLGSMQHICLQVSDIEAAYRILRDRGLSDEERFRPRVGRNGRRLMNLFDPDGTRTELMEPQPAVTSTSR